MQSSSRIAIDFLIVVSPVRIGVVNHVDKSVFNRKKVDVDFWGETFSVNHKTVLAIEITQSVE